MNEFELICDCGLVSVDLSSLGKFGTDLWNSLIMACTTLPIKHSYLLTLMKYAKYDKYNYCIVKLLLMVHTLMHSELQVLSSNLKDTNNIQKLLDGF